MRRPRRGSNGEASEEDAAEEPALEKLTAEDLRRSRGGAHGGGVGAHRRRERPRRKKKNKALPSITDGRRVIFLNLPIT